MAGYDIKREHRSLYAPRTTAIHRVDVPELSFLMADGHGDPNVSAAYSETVAALFTLSYGVRAAMKRDLGRVHVVGPLEGLWSADDPRAFTARDKGVWDWTMMIAQPPWITSELVESVRHQLRERVRPGLERVRLEPYAEGPCVQVLHVGSYDDEGPVLARIHDEYLPQHGLTFNGPHHEVYLSDPRRVAPARLRTVLRQPVAPVVVAGA